MLLNKSISNGKITITEVDSKRVRPLIEKYHYSHKTTPNHFISFDVNNGLGALQLGFGIRPHKKNRISSLITTDNYCEFDRMWLSDELPKYSESQTISLLLKYLKRNYPRIKFMITYADGSVGNEGIIYQATNAIKIAPIMCDFYLLPSGERVHPVSMWHRHKSRARELMQELYPGIKHIKGTKKNPIYQHRYLYILNKGLRKKFQSEKR
jgi:adenine modification enzyme